MVWLQMSPNALLDSKLLGGSQNTLQHETTYHDEVIASSSLTPVASHIYLLLLDACFSR
jgi:hypothetical protein